MKFLMNSIFDHPVLSATILVTITLMFALQLPRLVVDPSGEGMMLSDDPDKDYYDEVKETFGEDILVTVCITSDNVFQKEILQTVQNLTEKASELTLNFDHKEIEAVSEVISLTTTNKIVGSDGFLDIDSLIEEIPEEASDLEETSRNAQRNNVLRNNIISEDNKTTAVNIYVAAGPPGYVNYNHDLTRKIQELIDAEKKRLRSRGISADIFQIGSPQIKVALVDLIKRDMATLLPLAGTLILCILWISFRSLIAVIIPIATGFLSITWTLGFMAMMDFKINIITNIVPLLLLVVGCTEDIHMISEYAKQLRAGNAKNMAIRNMANKCGLAIFLTTLTTIIGFATLSANQITMLKEFGISAAVGLAFNFAITILFLPTFLRLARVPNALKSEVPAKNDSSFINYAANALYRLAVNKRILIITASIIITAISIIGGLRVKVDVDFVSSFKKHSEIRSLSDKLHNLLSGVHSFLIVFDSGRPGGIKDPEVMAAMARLQDQINPKFDKTISVADYVKVMNREMHDGLEEFFSVPDSSDLISQYLLLLEDDLDQFLDSTHSKACIIVRHNISGSWALNKELNDIRTQIKNLFPSYVQSKITGNAILINKASTTMATGQFYSLTLAVFSICIIISILFNSPKAGILATIPNLIPIITNFGIMGWLGIPLNPATCTVVVIALGIAVDDTIHLMVHFYKYSQGTSDQNEAMAQTLKSQFFPVFSTSVALALGFAVQLFSSMITNIQFGLLASSAMISALIGDLLIGPVVLLSTRLIYSWDIIKLKVDRELTKTSVLFHGLKPSEIKKLLLLGTISNFSDNDHIIKKGERSQMVYLIVEGEVQVSIPNKNKIKEQRLVKVLHRGEIFGEMAFITGEERSADVTAKGPVEVLRIDEKSLNNVRLRFPKIAAKVFYNMSHILSNRLKESTRELVQH